MRLPRKRGIFITGTDTGVGKTLIAGAIANLLASKGIKVGVFKPIATGCQIERGRMVSGDAKFLAQSCGTEFPLCKITPVCYLTPAAPIVSARVEKRPVDYSLIEDAYKQLCDISDFVIVEGIGGIRVPISDHVDVLELADQFALPVVVVARPNLGTINHTLLTVDAIRLNQLPFAGIIVSGYNPSSTDPAHITAPEVISSFGSVKLLATVPFDPDSSVEKLTLGQSTLDALSAVDWSKF